MGHITKEKEMNNKQYQKELDEAIQDTDDVVEANDIPQAGKVYRLTGGSQDKCIANGNSWSESEVKDE